MPDRLTLSQILEIERQKGGLVSFVPDVKGWVQATLRELPSCIACGQRMRLVEGTAHDYVCDHCGALGSEPGPIVKQVAQHNVILPGFAIWINNGVANTLLSRAELLISNDDQPTHPRKDLWFSTYANATYMDLNGTGSCDFANKIWTFSTTFSAPTAPGRYVRWVGMAYYPHYNVVTAYTYGRITGNAISGTKLTSELYQTDTQTLEIVYKYIFTEAT
jgi:hypothetical protein